MKIAAHCDALGNPIILGNKYGWSRNDSGFTHVTIGFAEKLTEKGVTLKIESGRRSLYDDDPKPMEIGGNSYLSLKEKINIKGMCLFPINE